MLRGPLHVCYCCRSNTAALRARTFFYPGKHITLYVCARCDGKAQAEYRRRGGRDTPHMLTGAWEDMAAVPFTGADAELDERLAREME